MSYSEEDVKAVFPEILRFDFNYRSDFPNSKVSVWRVISDLTGLTMKEVQIACEGKPSYRAFVSFHSILGHCNGARRRIEKTAPAEFFEICKEAVRESGCTLTWGVEIAKLEISDHFEKIKQITLDYPELKSHASEAMKAVELSFSDQR